MYFTKGYVWKDKSNDGVRKMLEDNVIPLDRLLIETDSPFMYPNFRSAKITPEMKKFLTPRFVRLEIVFLLQFTCITDVNFCFLSTDH